MYCCSLSLLVVSSTLSFGMLNLLIITSTKKGFVFALFCGLVIYMYACL